MQVYKFGGASIATPERMKAMLPILRDGGTARVLVVSAMGKTTNALETIVNAACRGDREVAAELVRDLEQQHLDYAQQLMQGPVLADCSARLQVFFTELSWSLDDADPNRFDYSYDQVVCLGELLSTTILSGFLTQEGYAHDWIDVRDVIRTDEAYRDPRVDWDYSAGKAQQVIGSRLEAGRNVLTQGFIGATSDNNSVTLGREGSDYTAALLGAMLGAESITIWKDVEGLQNADPKEFPDTVKIETITYHEVIEMAYYGAQVIHPKTIKPLQNHKIPLYVKCFLKPELKGTVIQNEVDSIVYPPLIILKRNQVLLQVTTRDFSFITEDNLSRLYQIFFDLRIKVNLIQNAAISFVACIDNNGDLVQQLIAELQKDYKVYRNEDLSLLTIRHYTPETLQKLTQGRQTLLEQKTRSTVQAVLK